MLRWLACLAIAALALGIAHLAAPALAGDADHRRVVTTHPQLADRGEESGRVCITSAYDRVAGEPIERVDRACPRRYDPLRAAHGDTLLVRTPRSANSASVGVSGSEREDEECRLLDHGRWLCTMPGDGDPSLVVGISYPFGVANFQADAQLRRPNRSARLRIVERAVPSGRTYIEGAAQIVRVRRVGEKGPFLIRVLKGRGFTAKLPAGEYVLWSTTRVCAGSCPARDGSGSLDPTRHTCRSRFDVERTERLTLTVVTRVGERCRIP